MTPRVSTKSTGYVYVPVSGSEGGVPKDPRPASVEVAFTAPDDTDPTAATRFAATWVGAPPTIEARALVDVGGVEPGMRRPWVHVEDSPEDLWLPCPDLIEFV